MGKSARTNIMRVYEQANNDLNRCLTNLRTLADLYEPGHSRQYTAITAVVGSVLLVQDMLAQIKSDLS